MKQLTKNRRYKNYTQPSAEKSRKRIKLFCFKMSVYNHLLWRKICRNVLNDFIKKIIISVRLPPHPLTQIGIQHCPVGTVLSLISHLCVFPGVFDILSVCPGDGVHEIIRMIYLQMCKPQCTNAPVGSPHVRHDGRAWTNRLLYYR